MLKIKAGLEVQGDMLVQVLVLLNKTYYTDIDTIVNFKKPTTPNLT